MGKMSVQLDISTKNLVLYDKISNYHESNSEWDQNRKTDHTSKKTKSKNLPPETGNSHGWWKHLKEKFTESLSLNVSAFVNWNKKYNGP